MMNNTKPVTTTITRRRDGQKFVATVFDTRAEAEAYAVAHPVLRRNASGSMLRHAAPVHKLADGRYAII